MSNKDYFYCYSPRLRRFIREGGTRWIEKGVNPKSGYPYWVFEHCKRLEELLKEYGKNK